MALTFDDGFQDVLDNAQPVLAKLGFTATVFVSTAVIDGEAKYTWAPPDAATASWAGDSPDGGFRRPAVRASQQDSP